MDRITISRYKGSNMDKEMIQICIQPGCFNGLGPMPIYEGIMELQEFAKCITNLSQCEIKTQKIREVPIENQ